MSAISGYVDYELLLEQAPPGYRVRVLDSPVGQAIAQVGPLPPALSLAGFLEQTGLPGREPQRDAHRRQGAVGDVRRAAQAYGAQLLDHFVIGDVRTSLRRSLDEAERQGLGLRLRLRLSEVPELAMLPWELLYDAAAGRFLALAAQTPLVRAFDLPLRSQPIATRPPLRILGIVASPRDYPHLEVEREWGLLRQALNGPIQAQVELERLDPPTIPALQAHLRQGSYHVLHFSGHGAFDPERREGALLFEDEVGGATFLSTARLGALLYDAQRSLRLVLLNACHGAHSSMEDPFSAPAQSLLRQGIPAVVAMQFAISDQAALTLSQTFYQALADGYPVEAALGEARKAVFVQGNELEWATPALFLRAPDGILWQMEGEEAMTRTAEEKPTEPPWWEHLPTEIATGNFGDVGGDIIIGHVGAEARGVAIGKQITQQIYEMVGQPTPSDAEVIAQELAELNQAAQRLDGPQAVMVQFQLKLLQGELTKTEESETPSASTITQVGDWLLDNVPQLKESLKSLFATPAVGRVVGKAGESAVHWVKQRFGRGPEVTR